MFCSNCGKELGYGHAFCSACGAPIGKSAEISDTERVFELVDDTQIIPASKTDDPEARVYGKGWGIAAIILAATSFLSIIFPGAIFAGFEDPMIAIPLMLMVPIAQCVLALIFGVKCIKAFIAMARAKRKRPTATLVLGIIGMGIAIEMLVALVAMMLSVWFIP